MQPKAIKLIWVALLVVSAFILGYYLNPRRQQLPGAMPFGSARPAPPLRFNP